MQDVYTRELADTRNHRYSVRDMESRHRFIAADARKLEGIPDESVDLVVTSPPYPMIGMWDGLFSAMSADVGTDLTAERGPAAFAGMHAILDEVWAELHRVLIPGGIVCINIGDATRRLGNDFRLYSNHSRIVSGMEKIGFAGLPSIHWRKTTNAPTKFMGSGMLPGAAYVTLEHEYILIFRKGAPRMYDAGRAGLRRESAIFWEERNLWFSDLWELGGSKQRMVPEKENTGGDKRELRERNAAFPFEIPYRLVLMHSIKGDTVLDPFVGTGTTMQAAAACERSSIGIDLEAAIVPFAAGALRRGLPVWRERAEKRLSDHKAFCARRESEGKQLGYRNRTHGLPVTTGQERELVLRLPGRVNVFENGEKPGFEAAVVYDDFTF